jgi:hypothetical protein
VTIAYLPTTHSDLSKEVGMPVKETVETSSPNNNAPILFAPCRHPESYLATQEITQKDQ